MRVLNLQEEEDLLDQLRKPNRRLENRLYRNWRRPFRRTLMRRFHCPEEIVDEMFSEAFTITIQNIRSGQLASPLTAALLTYCITVGRNVYSRYRPKNPSIPVEEDILTYLLEKMGEEETAELGDSELSFLVEKIESLLAQLDTPCQDILKGKYWYNYSHQDMVEEFDLPNENASRQRLHRCIARLRKQLIGR